MNDLYDETIERNGRTYKYDPDYDCYYRIKSTEEMTHWEAFGWIYCILILGIMCWLLSGTTAN